MSVPAPVVLVVAIADNDVIGDGNRIPWRIAEDMKRFKALTIGKPMIVGRKTYESFPRRPLPGRTNIVVTRDRTYAAEGAVVVHSFEEALARAHSENPPEVIVAGGADIYAQSLAHAARIELTEVHADVPGDTHFPRELFNGWSETARDERVTPEGLKYAYVTLARP